MTTTEFLKLRDEICDQLIAEGYDYDDAHFAAMTAGRIDGEGNKQSPTHPLLVKLAAAKDSITEDDRPINSPPPRMANQFDPF